MTRHSSPWRLAAPAVLAATIVLAACGGDDSARDDALDGLDRATEAADLQGEMAELVAAIPADTAQAGAEVETQLADIDGRATKLISAADTGTDYDEQIASAATDTQTAGTKVTQAVASAQPLDAVRPEVVGSLADSGKKLGSATTLIGTELEDENGELSDEDAEALEATLTQIDESDAAVAAAGDYRDLIFDSGGVGNLRVGMTEAEAEAATGMTIDFESSAGCAGVFYPDFPPLYGISLDGTTISTIGTGPQTRTARTAAGVGIGSSQAEVEAAYPGQIERDPVADRPGVESLVVPDGENAIVFAPDFAPVGEISFLIVGDREVFTRCAG